MCDTPVSGPYDPLTRRYAPAAAMPCRDHSDGAHQLQSHVIAGYNFAGKGG